MPPVRPFKRPVAASPPPPPAPSGLSFGDLSFYSGGFLLPEGDYAMVHDVIMHQPTKNDGTPVGPSRLGVMLTAYPLSGGEPNQQFLSMGTKAHESFAPDADTGKGIVAVPGGPGQQPNNQTNWSLYLKSLYDCGLPIGIFTNDVSVIDGVHVHTQNVPEPEGRKGYAAKTGEAGAEQQQQQMGPKLIPIVSEIKEDGKPWEGTGGVPDQAAPAAPVKAAPKAPAARPAARAAVAPAVAAVEPADDDLLTAAIAGMSAVLEKSPAGVTKLLMRTGTFKAVNAAQGEQMAQAVIETYFGSDEALGGVLGQLGYAVAGTHVKPQ